MASYSPTLKGSTNAFQRVMHQWSELYPYNAVHAYQIGGPLAAERLRDAIRQTNCDLGIGIVELEADGRAYRYEADASPPLEVLDGGRDPRSVLDGQIARELNRPFDRPRCRPLRYSAISGGPRSHYVCVGYDHWVADSAASRLILRHVLDRYLDLGLPENERPLCLYPDTYRKVFAHRLSKLGLARATRQVLAQLIRRPAICRVPYSSVRHMAVGYRGCSAAAGAVERLRQFARSHGATVHDVILAALSRAIAEHLPRRAVSDGDRPLAMGTIVDTRGDAEADLTDSLGAFLSYYTVRYPVRRGVGLGELCEHVAALTGPIKAGRGYLDALANMKLFSMVWPLLAQERRPHFARLVLPMTAGVSNVVIRDRWMDQPGGPILDYVRGSPTGPMLPLTLAVTTFAGRMNLGITYRHTGFTEARLQAVVAMLLEQLENPDGASQSSRQRQPAEASEAPAPCSAAA